MHGWIILLFSFWLLTSVQPIDIFQLAIACLPICYFLPVLSLMDRQSGMESLLSSFVIYQFWNFSSGVEINFSALSLCLIFLFVAWHRTLPILIKLFSLLLAATFALSLLIHDQNTALIILTCIFIFHLIENREWAKHRCFLVTVSIAHVSLLSLMLYLNEGKANFSYAHVLLSYVILCWSNVAICQWCGLSLRCREFVLSLFSQKLTIIYLYILLLGPDLGQVNIFLVHLFYMYLVASHMINLRPLRLVDLPENPCKSEFELKTQ